MNSAPYRSQALVFLHDSCWIIRPNLPNLGNRKEMSICSPLEQGARHCALGWLAERERERESAPHLHEGGPKRYKKKHQQNLTSWLLSTLKVVRPKSLTWFCAAVSLPCRLGHPFHKEVHEPRREGATAKSTFDNILISTVR